MTETIAEHCDFTAFVFVPNLCNAACPFCYVHPVLAQRAHASTAVLSRAAVTAEALATLGFREVRFTGGEPTLFSNLDQMIEPFLDHGFKYRVLTNGIRVDNHYSFFKNNAPERFTISVHDTVHPETAFGVQISAETCAENRRTLTTIADVEASIVIRGARLEWKQIDRTLSDLQRDGVLHVKVILENSRHGQDDRLFDSKVHDLASKWSTRFRSFRYTDTRPGTCKLPDKSFPSIDLGSSTVFACCVQVGDRTLPSGYSGNLPLIASAAVTQFSGIIEYARAARSDALPCKAGISFCPLGLTQ